MSYLIRLIFKAGPSKAARKPAARKSRPMGNPNAYRLERMERDSQRAAASRLGV